MCKLHEFTWKTKIIQIFIHFVSIKCVCLGVKMQLQCAIFVTRCILKKAARANRCYNSVHSKNERKTCFYTYFAILSAASSLTHIRQQQHRVCWRFVFGLNASQFIRSIYSIMFLHFVDNNNELNWIFIFLCCCCCCYFGFYASCIFGILKTLSAAILPKMIREKSFNDCECGVCFICEL